MSKMNKNAEAVAAIPAALYSACNVGIVRKVSMKVGISSRPFRTPEFFVLGSARPIRPSQCAADLVWGEDAISA
jgi:hypothetical protein